MIENEILILRRVRHPHIVELIEEFETPKEILLVMELVPVSETFIKIALYAWCMFWRNIIDIIASNKGSSKKSVEGLYS